MYWGMALPNSGIYYTPFLRAYIDFIGEVLQKGQMIRCMNADEARGVYKDRSRWCSVISAYPYGKKA